MLQRRPPAPRIPPQAVGGWAAGYWWYGWANLDGGRDESGRLRGPWKGRGLRGQWDEPWSPGKGLPCGGGRLAGWPQGSQGVLHASLAAFFFIFFFEDHLFTPHPASPRSPVTVSPQGESLGVWSRGPGVLGKSALPRPSCKAKKGAEQEAGVCFAQALVFFFPMGAPLVSGFGWLGLETACSLLSLVPFGLVWLEAERTWS